MLALSSVTTGWCVCLPGTNASECCFLRNLPRTTTHTGCADLVGTAGDQGQRGSEARRSQKGNTLHHKQSRTHRVMLFSA